MADQTFKMPNFLFSNIYGVLDYDSGTIHGKRVSVSWLREICNTLTVILDLKLGLFLKNIKQVESLEMHDFDDNFRVNNISQSALDYTSKSKLVKVAKLFFLQVTRGFRLADGSLNVKIAVDFMQKCKFLRKVILVLMRITGGQTPRSTEMVDLTFRNTSSGDRSVRVVGGTVVLGNICSCTWSGVIDYVIFSIHI